MSNNPIGSGGNSGAMTTTSPCQLRALWIINESNQLVLSRKFPTVEKRQQAIMHNSTMNMMNRGTGHHTHQQQPYMEACRTDVYSISDSVLVKTYLNCLSRVMSDQLSNECFLLFSLKLNQKRLFPTSSSSSAPTTPTMDDTLTDTGAPSTTTTMMMDNDETDVDTMTSPTANRTSSRVTEELLMWPFVGIVVGGVSFVALPYMDASDCRKFCEFYHSQMTELQKKKDSLVFHLTNTFRNKCVVTTHRLPFNSHQNNNESTRAFDLIDMTSVTGALCALQDLSSAYFLARSQPKPTNVHQNMDHVALYMHMFLSQSMPFGRPIDTSTNVHQMISRPLVHLAPQNRGYMDQGFDRKKPSWRSHEPRLGDGKQQQQQRISFIVRETIDSIQYDNRKIPDIWSCYGTIVCSAEVAGSPDISVQLSNLSNMQQFAAHRCCSQYPQVLCPTNPFTLVFNPPAGGFVLCKYNVCDESTSMISSGTNAPNNSTVRLPLRGFYQMIELDKEEINGMDAVEMVIQLKLDKSVSNNFEYCNVYIPFPNKRAISDFKLSQPTVGQVTKSNSAHALIWKIGNKFKTKDLEVVLTAKVFFNRGGGTGDDDVVSDRKRDPMLVGTNAYIKLNYKLLDHSLSGLEIDNRTISTSPASQFSQVVIKHEIVSNNCLIWNSLANDVRHVLSIN